MKSTREGPPATFLGVDPSDRYAKRRRASAVCGLDPVEGGLAARLWAWEWPAAGASLDVAGVLEEVRAARAVLIDGPQGLAAPGKAVRQAEAHAKTPGRTPDTLPEPGPPYAGYIRSSVELFAALYHARVRISPTAITGGAGEVYPGAFWARFADLPKKTTKAGRAARGEVLRALGVRFEDDASPSHDELDACVAALGAAAAAGAVRGVYARARGAALSLGPDGLLREGPIVEIVLQGPQIAAAQAAVARALAPPDEAPTCHSGLDPESASATARHSGLDPVSDGRRPGETGARVPSEAEATTSSGTRKTPGRARGDKQGVGSGTTTVSDPTTPQPAPPSEAPPAPPDDPALRARADALLDALLRALERGRPAVVTYATAHRLLYPGTKPERWLPHMAREVVAAAMHSKREPVEGLGPVALDTFVVDSVTGRPGRGHWGSASYDVDAWRAVFGLANQAGASDLRGLPARPRPSRGEDP